MAIRYSDKHRTVHLTIGDDDAEIDVKIASLVKEMWQAGITTTQSCQDSPPGWIWLEFASSGDLAKFLNIVGEYQNRLGSFHDRMLHGYDRLSRPRVGQWGYQAIVHDMAVDIVEDGVGEREEYAGSPDFVVLLSLQFPQRDLRRVLTRLRRFNTERTATTTTAAE